MRDISLHLLDLAQNSVKAGAKEISILLTLSDGWLKIKLSDDGCGMTQQQAARAADSPFVTSRTTRKVGLGLPLCRAACERTGGSLEISSRLHEGTVVTFTFNVTSIDCPPLGDVAGTVAALCAACPDKPEILFVCGDARFDTREIKRALDGVSLAEPEVIQWIQSSLREELQPIIGGVSL